MDVILRENSYSGYGKHNSYYFEYRLENGVVSKYKIHKYKFFDGKENEWRETSQFIESWEISDPKLPDQVKNALRKDKSSF